MKARLSVGWLLVSLLLWPLASRAQSIGSGSPRGSIAGTVLFGSDDRPAERVKVQLRPLSGGPVAAVFTGWGGAFELTGLHEGTYIIAVEESGFEPIEETVHLHDTGTQRSLRFYLRKINLARSSQTGYAVSARELSIPPKARREFQKGLDGRAKGDPAGSLTHFQRALAEHPSYYEACLQLGLVYMQLGQREDAEKAIRKAIELSGDSYADADFVLGGLLWRQKQFADAEKIIRQGLVLDPDSWQGHYELGRALLGVSRLDEAEQSAQKARSIKADSPVVYLLLSNIHFAQHNYAAQLKDLEDYLKLDPNSPLSATAREVRDNVQRILSPEQSPSATTPPKP